jgi:hypothetical protein
MSVRDEDHVDLDVVKKMRHGARVAMKRTEPVREHGIGEYADSVHLEQHRRVTQIAKHAHRARLPRGS